MRWPVGRSRAGSRSGEEVAPALAGALRALGEGRCPSCGAREEAEDLFFTWFLAETYQFPETLDPLSRSHGFCPAHTRAFVKGGVPSTVAFVYRRLAAAALSTVEAAERRVERAGDVRGATRLLLPHEPCLACVRVGDHVAYGQRLLGEALRSPRLRARVPPEPALCLPHLRALAPGLDREGLRLIAAGLRKRLAAPDPGEVLRWTWGEPPPPAGRASAEAPGLRGPSTVDALAEHLRSPGCPVCRAETAATTQSLRWLAREEGANPLEGGRMAFQLCPEHGWAFAQGEEGGAELGRGIGPFQSDRLAQLERALAAVPTGVRNRWRHLEFALHDRTPPRGERLRAALEEALRPQARGVRDRARRALRPEPCPACGAAATARERTAALIAASIGHPVVRTAYEEGDGLCLRHLPSALAQSRPEDALVLIRAARVRLAVLGWELEEFLRKQSWGARFEGAGPEGGAWHRAAEFLSGGGP